jgi:putative heme-binding domain-containing protein
MIAVLFGAIRGGVIKPLEIPSTQRARLLQQNDPALRKEAETAFREFEGADRMQVYRTYRDVVKNEADVAAGRPVFVRVCSACRTCNDAGGKVGPGSDRPAQPAGGDTAAAHHGAEFRNHAGYQAFSATLQDGRNLSGWLVAEGDSSVALRTVGGTDETGLRANLASLAATPVSLMPHGLEQTMTKDEMANLITYIKDGIDLGQ